MKTWRTGLLLPATLVISLCLTLITLISFDAEPAYSADEEVLKPRVPANRLAEVKGLANIVTADAKTLSEAKDIFAGKGVCFTCHGTEGRGDGAAGASFNPRPRNFTDADWQRARTDGEIFWAITKGTDYGMIAFEDMLSVEERWMLVTYIRELGKSSVGIASKEK